MKNRHSIINAPVVYNFFIRPDISLQVINEIKKVRPKKLYLISDGPRSELESDLLYKNRNQIEELIDWECNLVKYYSVKNIGFDKIMDITYELVFKDNDRMIFLEEDILPTTSFFLFCEELLEKYKNDNQIYMISGMNFLEKYPVFGPSYFFSNTASTWGMAIWKRTYASIQKDLSILNDPYYNKLIRYRMISNHKKKDYQHLMLKYEKPDLVPYDGEFWLMGFNQNVLYNSLAIVPSINLVKNIGYSNHSENSDEIKMFPKSLRRVALLKSFEIEFPLVHPLFRIPEDEYIDILKKNNHRNPISKSFDKLERSLRILIYGGFQKFYFKLQKFFSRTLNYERIKNRYK